MRFSDAMLSVSFVSLAAAEPSPTRPAYRLCMPGNDVVRCIPLGHSPSTSTCPTATVHTHTATKTVHAHTETVTADAFIATTTIPTTIATILAIPTATETHYKLELATPSSAASRRYSIPGLFMLPLRIMGLMAGAQPAAAGAATKTVDEILRRTKTETVHVKVVLPTTKAETEPKRTKTETSFVLSPVTTEFEPEATKVVLPPTKAETESKRTKTETSFVLSPVTTEFEPEATKVVVLAPKAEPADPAPRGNSDGSSGGSSGGSGYPWKVSNFGTRRLARRAITSDELSTTTFVPTTTETFLPQPTSTVPVTTETFSPQPTSTIELIRVVIPNLDTINVAINTDTDKTDTVILPSVSTEPTVTTTRIVKETTTTTEPWGSPSVTLPSFSTESTVTNTHIVEDTTRTTKISVEPTTFTTPLDDEVTTTATATAAYTHKIRRGTTTLTAGATQTAQPPKIFRVIASLIRK